MSKMFKSKPQFDLRKLLSKFQDTKKDCFARLRYLKDIIVSKELPNEKQFFINHHSIIYSIFYDAFIHLDAAKYRGSSSKSTFSAISETPHPDGLTSANRDEVELMLFTFERILLLLPEMLSNEWQLNSIVFCFRKMLHYSNILRIRIDGVRLYLLYYQIVGERLVRKYPQLEVLYAALIPGLVLDLVPNLSPRNPLTKSGPITAQHLSEYPTTILDSSMYNYELSTPTQRTSPGGNNNNNNNSGGGGGGGGVRSFPIEPFIPSMDHSANILVASSILPHSTNTSVGGGGGFGVGGGGVNTYQQHYNYRPEIQRYFLELLLHYSISQCSSICWTDYRDRQSMRGFEWLMSSFIRIYLPYIFPQMSIPTAEMSSSSSSSLSSSSKHKQQPLSSSPLPQHTWPPYLFHTLISVYTPLLIDLDNNDDRLGGHGHGAPSPLPILRRYNDHLQQYFVCQPIQQQAQQQQQQPPTATTSLPGSSTTTTTTNSTSSMLHHQHNNSYSSNGSSSSMLSNINGTTSATSITVLSPLVQLQCVVIQWFAKYLMDRDKNDAGSSNTLTANGGGNTLTPHNVLSETRSSISSYPIQPSPHHHSLTNSLSYAGGSGGNSSSSMYNNHQHQNYSNLLLTHSPVIIDQIEREYIRSLLNSRRIYVDLIMSLFHETLLLPFVIEQQQQQQQSQQSQQPIPLSHGGGDFGGQSSSSSLFDSNFSTGMMIYGGRTPMRNVIKVFRQWITKETSNPLPLFLSEPPPPVSSSSSSPSSPPSSSPQQGASGMSKTSTTVSGSSSTASISSLASSSRSMLDNQYYHPQYVSTAGGGGGGSGTVVVFDTKDDNAAEQTSVAAGMQNFLNVFIISSANVFLLQIPPDQQHILDLQVDVCKRVFNIYRYMVMKVEMDDTVWLNLVQVLIQITQCIVTSEIPVKREDTLGGRLAPALFQTLIVTWIKANLNVHISESLWDRFHLLVCSLTRWEELIQEWSQTMNILNRVMSRYIFNLNLSDLPLERVGNKRRIKDAAAAGGGGGGGSSAGSSRIISVQSNATTNTTSGSVPIGSNTQAPLKTTIEIRGGGGGQPPQSAPVVIGNSGLYPPPTSSSSSLSSTSMQRSVSVDSAGTTTSTKVTSKSGSPIVGTGHHQQQPPQPPARQHRRTPSTQPNAIITTTTNTMNPISSTGGVGGGGGGGTSSLAIHFALMQPPLCYVAYHSIAKHRQYHQLQQSQQQHQLSKSYYYRNRSLSDTCLVSTLQRSHCDARSCLLFLPPIPYGRSASSSSAAAAAVAAHQAIRKRSSTASINLSIIGQMKPPTSSQQSRGSGSRYAFTNTTTNHQHKSRLPMIDDDNGSGGGGDQQCASSSISDGDFGDEHCTLVDAEMNNYFSSSNRNQTRSRVGGVHQHHHRGSSSSSSQHHGHHQQHHDLDFSDTSSCTTDDRYSDAISSYSNDGVGIGGGSRYVTVAPPMMTSSQSSSSFAMFSYPHYHALGHLTPRKARSIYRCYSADDIRQFDYYDYVNSSLNNSTTIDGKVMTTSSCFDARHWSIWSDHSNVTATTIDGGGTGAASSMMSSTSNDNHHHNHQQQQQQQSTENCGCGVVVATGDGSTIIPIGSSTTKMSSSSVTATTTTTRIYCAKHHPDAAKPIILGGQYRGWNAEVSGILWRRMLGILGDPNDIPDPLMHRLAFECLGRITEDFIRLKDNLSYIQLATTAATGDTGNGTGTALITTSGGGGGGDGTTEVFQLSLHYYTAWLFRATTLSNEYKAGKLIAYKLLCTIALYRCEQQQQKSEINDEMSQSQSQSSPTSNNHQQQVVQSSSSLSSGSNEIQSREFLIMFYLAIKRALASYDMELTCVIVKYCGQKFFSSVLYGSSCLLFDFISAANMIVSSQETKWPRAEALHLLGSLIGFFDVYSNVLILRNSTSTPSLEMYKDLKEHVLEMLIIASKREQTGLGRSIALCSLGIFLYKEFQNHTEHHRLKEIVNILVAGTRVSIKRTKHTPNTISSSHVTPPTSGHYHSSSSASPTNHNNVSDSTSKFNNRVLCRVACDQLRLQCDHAAYLVANHADLVLLIIEGLCNTLLLHIEVLQQQQQTFLYKEFKHLLLVIQFTLAHWCMSVPKDFLLNTTVSKEYPQFDGEFRRYPSSRQYGGSGDYVDDVQDNDDSNSRNSTKQESLTIIQLIMCVYGEMANLGFNHHAYRPPSSTSSSILTDSTGVDSTQQQQHKQSIPNSFSDMDTIDFTINNTSGLAPPASQFSDRSPSISSSSLLTNRPKRNAYVIPPEVNTIKLAAELILLHFMNFIGHWPIPQLRTSSLCALINECDDNVHYNNTVSAAQQQHDSSTTTTIINNTRLELEALNTPNVLMFIINGNTLITFLELSGPEVMRSEVLAKLHIAANTTTNNATTTTNIGNTSATIAIQPQRPIRMIVRNLLGKFCWDICSLYAPVYPTGDATMLKQPVFTSKRTAIEPMPGPLNGGTSGGQKTFYGSNTQLYSSSNDLARSRTMLAFSGSSSGSGGGGGNIMNQDDSDDEEERSDSFQASLRKDALEQLVADIYHQSPECRPDSPLEISVVSPSSSATSTSKMVSSLSSSSFNAAEMGDMNGEGGGGGGGNNTVVGVGFTGGGFLQQLNATPEAVDIVALFTNQHYQEKAFLEEQRYNERLKQQQQQLQQQQQQKSKSATTTPTTTTATTDSQSSMINFTDPSVAFAQCRSLIEQFGFLSWEKRASIDLIDTKSQSLLRELRHLDLQRCRETHKIAVIYVGAGQETKEAILGNRYGSRAFEEFVSRLGWEVPLASHVGFMGGLESNLSTGISAPYYADSFNEVIFHVSTRLEPVVEQQQQLMDNQTVGSDQQQPEQASRAAKEIQMKKMRHLGNDEVHIVWSEHYREYRRTALATDFCDALIVIYPLPPGTYANLYRIQVSRKPEVPFFGPLFNGVVVHRDELAPLVRATAINASKAKRSCLSAFKQFFEERSDTLCSMATKHRERCTFEQYAMRIFAPRYDLFGGGGTIDQYQYHQYHHQQQSPQPPPLQNQQHHMNDTIDGQHYPPQQHNQMSGLISIEQFLSAVGDGGNYHHQSSSLLKSTNIATTTTQQQQQHSSNQSDSISIASNVSITGGDSTQNVNPSSTSTTFSTTTSTTSGTHRNIHHHHHHLQPSSGGGSSSSTSTTTTSRPTSRSSLK